MTSYLLQGEHEVLLPAGKRPSPEAVADWLEQRMRSEGLRVSRLGDAVIEFRSRFRILRGEYFRPTLKFLARGEIEINEGPGGPVITVRANPHIWDGLIPMIPLTFLFGWTAATGVLRLAAGLGGILVGGVVLFLNWSALQMFLQSASANLRIWQTKRSYLPLLEGDNTVISRQ